MDVAVDRRCVNMKVASSKADLVAMDPVHLDGRKFSEVTSSNKMVMTDSVFIEDESTVGTFNKKRC